MEPVYGIHLGMVVNNEDPEGRKRVQVYIPYLTNTIYSKLNDNNKNFEFKNTTEIPFLDKLKIILPWAEAAAPLFGGSTSVTSNNETGRVTVNNSNPAIGLDIKPANGFSTGFDNGLTQNSSGKPIDTTGNLYTTTKYSFSTSVGGLDSVNKGKGDSGTNKGLGNYGRQVLGSGALAIGAGTGFKNGQILQDQYGNVGIVVDTAGVPNVVDIFGVKTYNNNYQENLYWKVVGTVDKLPQNNQELQQQLKDKGYTQLTGDGYGAPSAADYLAAAKDGKIDPNYNNTAIASNNETLVDGEGNIINNDPNLLDSNTQGGKNYAAATTPNYNTASGSPNGILTVPNTSAKVWVFFYGGDIQRPVYFASAIDQT